MKIRSKSSTTRVITGGDTTYVVEPGATVDVPAELGKSLCAQPDRWEQVTKKSTTVDDGDKG